MPKASKARRPQVAAKDWFLGVLAARINIHPTTGCWKLVGNGDGFRTSKKRPVFNMDRLLGQQGGKAKDEVNVARVLLVLSIGAQTGPDNTDLVASHLCHNENCVNPAHIVGESQGQNDRRSYCAGPAACRCHATVKCLAEGNKYLAPNDVTCKTWDAAQSTY